MNPLEQRVQQLEIQVAKMRSATDVVFIEEMRRRLTGLSVSVQDGASTSGTTIAVRNSADSGSEVVADDYDGVATLYSNGVEVGRIGYYS